MQNDLASATPLDPALLDDYYYAKTVVVPLGRPDAAIEMLKIAGELVHPPKGWLSLWSFR